MLLQLRWGRGRTGEFLPVSAQCRRLYLFLIGCENKEFLIRNELRNCYAGFSQPVSGISSLKKAYEQAVLGRHEAFARAIKVVDCNEAT